MRLAWLIVFIVSFGYAQAGSERLLVYADHNPKAVRIASLKLQLQREEEPTLDALFASYHLQSRIRHYGAFHVLTIGPIWSMALHNALLAALAPKYPGLFFIRQSLAPPGGHALEKPAARPVFMEKNDWIWLAIFLLALAGLIGLILQRKGWRKFSHQQHQLRNDQKQMDESIDALQGDTA